MKKTIYLFFILCVLHIKTFAQFDPAAGQPGSLAIHKDDVQLVSWASGCQSERGFQDISNPALGYASTGNDIDATGKAGEGGTLSLGDGGWAVLTFPYPISNGLGADFVVFENAFSDTFLELAFVEVSSDGQHFVRFPSISNTPIETQIGTFGAVDATDLYNLAGKYRANYGTAFDLEELKDSLNIDIQNITHVKIIDVVGCIQPAYARYDSRGVIINEPWNTPFPQSGFDLDGIAVIHSQGISPVESPVNTTFTAYPNPIKAGDFLHISSNLILEKIHIYNTIGQLVLYSFPNSSCQIPPDLSPGLYDLILEDIHGQKQHQRLVITK